MERRKFTREFKREAVRLIKDRGVSYGQASQDLNVHTSQLRDWVKKFSDDPQSVLSVVVIISVRCHTGGRHESRPSNIGCGHRAVDGGTDGRPNHHLPRSASPHHRRFHCR
jgi:hypothetical protein